MPQRELASLQLPAHHLRSLQDLLRLHVPTAEVWAYGSRVTGGAHAGSDLDLVLRHPADPSHPVHGQSELREALQRSALPMLVDLHDWADLPTEFHRNIERGFVVVQPTDHGRKPTT